MEASQLAMYQKRFQTFLSKYGSLYPEEVLKFIKKEFERGINYPCSIDILMQVYQEIGVNFSMPSFYEAHLKKLMSQFDIGCNVVDVASGRIPSFANLIAEEQLRIGKGTITLYDRALLPFRPKYANMFYKKELFTPETDTSNADLIVATLPCAATESIIENACRNHKKFYIAMCGCTHFDPYEHRFDTSLNAYQQHIINLAELFVDQFDNGELYVDCLSDDYTINHPILYNKK